MRPVAWLVVAMLLPALPARASEPEGYVTIDAPDGYLLAGDAVVVHATLHRADGSAWPHRALELMPYGKRALTNDHGDAIFSVTGSPGTVLADVELPGTSIATAFHMLWRAPRVVIIALPPEDATTDATARFGVLATLAPDGEPLTGESAALFADGTLVDTATTDARGAVAFALTATQPGNASYSIAFDDPRLDGQAQSATIRWRAPSIAAPPTPDPPPPRAPSVASVRITLEAGMARADVTGVYDPDGHPVTLHYRWLGDGAPVGSDAASVAPPPGAHLRVEVTPDDGVLRGATVSSSEVAIPRAPVAPIASFVVSGDAIRGRAVSFDASASQPVDAGYAWSFSDGATASGRTATHAFAASGPAFARLTVTTSEGLVGTATRELAIAEPPSAPEDASVNATPAAPRVVRSFDGGRALLQGADGLLFQDAPGGATRRVREAGAQLGATSAQPGELRVGARPTVDGLALARLADPQPGLALRDVVAGGASAPWWRDAGGIAIIAEGDFTLVYATRPLTVVADVMDQPDGSRLVRATASGGGLLEGIELRVGDTILARASGASVEARVPASPDALVVEAVARASGEVARASVTLPARGGSPTPTPPTAGSAENANATVNLTQPTAEGGASNASTNGSGLSGIKVGAPLPAFPWIAGALGLAALAARRKR